MTAHQTIQLLRRYESRNVTFFEADGSWPIVWERAKGMWVWDAGGKRYLDFTAAFGVAAAGHANTRVVKAGQKQLARLAHAMGDVHPHALKAELARELSRLTFERWTRQPSGAVANGRRPSGSRYRRGKTIFGNSGFEAVEAALKTALLATDKPGVIAFEKAYHGLGYGALNATHRGCFRSPFRRQLAEFADFAAYPSRADELPGIERQLRRLCQAKAIGAILVEPLQGRGGMRVPPPEFLPLLRTVCDRFGALLILDEVYTGFGRTGRWFACEHSRTVPDLICLGKALTGGFPLSACVGRADIMDAAWPVSNGEAIHTSTFLGNPVGCAMALAEIAEIRDGGLVGRSERMGRYLAGRLEGLAAKFKAIRAVRGMGLMLGIELADSDGAPATGLSLATVKRMLQAGYLLLPEGEWGEVIGLTPPLIVRESHLDRLCGALEKTWNAEGL